MPASPLLTPRWLLNIGILALIAVLVAITVMEPGIEKPPAVTRLTEFTPQQVTHVTISNNDTPIELSMQDGQWMMQSPLKVHANAVNIAALLDIVSAKSHAHYAATTVDLKALRLDPPKASMVLNKHINIYFGGNEAIDYRRYVMTENQVHLITDRHFHRLAAGVYGFISPALLPPGVSINKIDLPDAITLSQIDGSWKTSPGQSLSADSLAAFVTQWQNAQSLQVKKFSAKLPKKFVVLHINRPPQEIRMHILQQASTTWLVRADLGIQYELAPDSVRKLLDINAHQPQTDTPPATK